MDISSSAGMSISTLKWPELATIAPFFITPKWRPSSTCMSPVTVTKMSPSRAASSAGITSKPSITASRAFSGSTSHTITWAPWPLARIATPLPHQP